VQRKNLGTGESDPPETSLRSVGVALPCAQVGVTTTYTIYAQRASRLVPRSGHHARTLSGCARGRQGASLRAARSRGFGLDGALDAAT